MFKVTRSFPPPASLAARRNYAGDDVLEALNRDFLGKCYICETQEPLSLNVEHFVAHEGDEELTYAWENLFLSCARCNNFKRHHYNNLLNCTDDRIDILRAIEHIAPASPGAKVRIIARLPDESTQSTAELIHRIFNEDNTGNKKVTSAYMKKRLFSEYATFVRYINKYIDPNTIEEDKAQAVLHIRHMVRDAQQYSAFLRWVALNDPTIYALVDDIIPVAGD
ncbi:HNH endonuclease [Pseudomonas sp. 51_B]|uniref:HNH endonuclease n=1 Tax=Pseudomonas sp. 51_B TaxID=2813573 RepID=UPI001A9D64A7|nr:HNH endonuclease [Pseudomonas sp. 51_B]